MTLLLLLLLALPLWEEEEEEGGGGTTDEGIDKGLRIIAGPGDEDTAAFVAAAAYVRQPSRRAQP